MKKSFALILSFIGAGVISTGCVSGELNRKLDAKLASEPPITNQAQLGAESQATIAQAKDLTPEQKQQLNALAKSVADQVASLRDQSLKLRSILVKDLVAENYDSDEVRLIKSKLKKIEGKRLNLTFDAVEKANAILGHMAAENLYLEHDFFEPRYIRFE